MDTNNTVFSEKYEARIMEVLEINKEYFVDPDKPMIEMKFSHDAAAWFDRFKEEILYERGIGGCFANVQDHAARLPEQVARLAATIQFFENPDSDISLDTLKTAIDICAYCSDCFLTMFDTPQEVIDARKLDEWITINLRASSGTRYFPKNQIRQFGPNQLRVKNRLNHALLELQKKGVIRMFMIGSQHYIDLYPSLPHDSTIISNLLTQRTR